MRFKLQEDKLYKFLSGNQAKVLLVSHNRGGGVEKHIYELISTIPNNVEIVLLKLSSDGSGFLEIEFSGKSLLFFDHHNDLDLFCEFLSAINLIRIHFHQTKGFSQAVLSRLVDLEIPWDYTIHDYYTICPQITLINKQGEYCQEKGKDDCALCLKKRPAPGKISIEQWRKKHQFFVEQAERCFVPSMDVKKRMSGYFPEANYIVVYHELIQNLAYPRSALIKGDRLRVIVLGALTPMKGANLLEAVAIDAKQRELPIDFFLIGKGYRKLTCKPVSQLEVSGQYCDAELQAMIRQSQADVIWFPARCPETYSYTLTAALIAGLPVVAPDIGAFQERLYQRPLSWIVPWDLKAENFNKFFVSLNECLQQNCIASFDSQFIGRINLNIFPSKNNFNYRLDYLNDVNNKEAIINCDVDLLYEQYKSKTKPSVHLVSSIKYNVLLLLNRLRQSTFFSKLVKYIPQSLQTYLKSWLLGESSK